MNMNPLGDRVLVRALENSGEKIGSIIVPDTAKEKPEQGQVVAVGPGRMNKGGQRLDMEVTTGDTVLFARWSGTEVNIDGDTYLVMKEADILAIL